MTGESSYQRVTGSSSAPVCWASSAGPAGIRVASPKKSPRRRRGQVPVGEQADQAAGPQPPGQGAERRRRR